MRNDTRNSINKKISELKEEIQNGDPNAQHKLTVYKHFHPSNTDKLSRDQITDYYKNEICGLWECLKKLNNTDPYYDDPYYGKIRHRTKKDYRIGLKQVNNSGDVPPIKDKSEKWLQRHLLYNRESYREDLGYLIGYEVVVPYENRLAPIDLIGVKKNEGTLTFTLIELKVCKISAFNTEPSKELLARAIFEIATYETWFRHALLSPEDGLCAALLRELSKVEGYQSFTEEDIRNAKIEKIVLAPDDLINELQNECYRDFKPYQKDFTFLSIREKTNNEVKLSPDSQPNQKGQFFKIGE